MGAGPYLSGRILSKRSNMAHYGPDMAIDAIDPPRGFCKRTPQGCKPEAIYNLQLYGSVMEPVYPKRHGMLHPFGVQSKPRNTQVSKYPRSSFYFGLTDLRFGFLTARDLLPAPHK